MMQCTEDKFVELFKFQLFNTKTSELKDKIDKALIRAVMDVNRQNQTQSAKDFELNRGTFRAKLIKHGLVIINDKKGG